MPKSQYKNRRRRYKKVELAEVSLVDKPAQEGAQAEFVKRDDEALVKNIDEAVRKALAEQEGQMTAETQTETAVYKSAVTGQEYRTEGEIDLAKRLDAQVLDQEIAKRAADEFPLAVAKGDENAGAAAVKAILKGGDEAAIAGMKAIEASLAETSKAAAGRMGEAIGSTDEPAQDVGNYAQFEVAAEKWARENDVPRMNAAEAFAKTVEGQAYFVPGTAN